MNEQNQSEGGEWNIRTIITPTNKTLLFFTPSIETKHINFHLVKIFYVIFKQGGK